MNEGDILIKSEVMINAIRNHIGALMPIVKCSNCDKVVKVSDNYCFNCGSIIYKKSANNNENKWLNKNRDRLEVDSYMGCIKYKMNMLYGKIN